ncbi:MAG: DUF255 domain-containing protein [Planctomycetes bacterium]|nr:DUF255 domain-containing protein [Planctomycetota bacterium]
MKASSLWLLCSAALVAQKPTVVEAAIKIADTTNRAAMPLVAPLSETVDLAAADAAVAGLAGCWSGTLSVGGKSVLFAIGKSKDGAERADTIAIDLDGDGRIGDAERMALEVTEVPARGGGQPGERGKPVEVTFALGASKLSAKANYMKMGERPVVNVQFPGYLEGKATIAGSERIVCVLDKNFDGRFDGAEDLWMVGKAGDRPMQSYALSLLGERRFTDGHLVSLKVGADNSLAVTEEAASGPDQKAAAAHRERVEHMWAGRFDKEREQFVTQRKLDTTRPRAAKGIEWHYVSFDEAIALGKKANKPVFIDVMAFWCVWCYRMDYYTYIDQEVADTLNHKFIACKIIQEQDVAGDYDKMMKERLEAQGIPAMGIFDGDGKRLHKIGGWKAPADFLTDLQTGLTAFGGK